MKILDLFCCEGGAARGYQNAGFTVDGVDLDPKYRKRYAGDTFYAEDALWILRSLIDSGGIADYAAVHASPPCQRYSITNAARQADYPDLIGPTRTLLEESGLPWVIETVVGAPLIDPVLLCGSMFGLSAVDDDGTPLRMERHRLFESNVPIPQPSNHHHDKAVQVAGSYGGARRDKWEARHVRKGGYVPSKRVQQELLGVDWMTQYGLFQSIPPAYAEYVGGFLVRAGVAA